MFFILDLFFLLSRNVRYIRATMSHHGRVTLSSQPWLYLILFFRSCFRTLPQCGMEEPMLIVKSPSTLFLLIMCISSLHISKSRAAKNCVHCLYPFTRQVITATSAPGEMTALWTKSGGKIAPRVALESVIKQEWCLEVKLNWISFWINLTKMKLIHLASHTMKYIMIA